MKGWILDFFRIAGGYFILNLKKSLFRWRKCQGKHPCQNGSDSGKALLTGCDAVLHWSKPERLLKVCPLLRHTDRGWVCGVDATQTRPFWGRALLAYGGALLALCILALALVYGGMRLVGYRVSLRQLVWPANWHELQQVRADLFVRNAQNNFAVGKVDEAIRSLSVAHGINPGNYEVGLLLAQFYMLGRYSQADAIFRQLIDDHPERRNATARIWFRNLLARGRLGELGRLAREEMVWDPANIAVWTNAFLFATRKTGDTELLEEVADDSEIPEDARDLVALAARVRHAKTPATARDLLLNTPAAKDFPYGMVYRLDALIRLGFPKATLAALPKVKDYVGGRDFARLILDAFAKAGDRDRVANEFGVLLATSHNLQPAEVTLLATHLVRHPDRALLARVAESFGRLAKYPKDEQLQVVMAIFCAAGTQGDDERMAEFEGLARKIIGREAPGMADMRAFFNGKSAYKKIGSLLPRLRPISLELSYALVDSQHRG